MEDTLGVERSLVVILLLQLAVVVLSLLAGGTLIAHVDPTSECVLFSYQETQVEGEEKIEHKLSYGEPYLCEVIGYGFIATNVLIFTTAYLTLRQRNFISHIQKQFSIKSFRFLKIAPKVIFFHGLTFLFLLGFSAALTTGYYKSCMSFQTYIETILRSKLNEDPNDLRGERVEERFTEDTMFWRYTQMVKNVFGGNVFTIQTSCRTLFTDPDISTVLHDNHVKKYGGYFGWWYHQDIYSFDARAQSVWMNVLIEASLAGAWLGTFAWLAATIFLLIQKRRLTALRLEGSQDAADSTSLRSSSSNRPNSSASRLSRNNSSPAFSLKSDRNVYTSITSNASSYSRKDIDDLALGSILDQNFYKTNSSPGIRQKPKSRAQIVTAKNLQLQLQSQPLLIRGGSDGRREHYETEIM